ncbi:hypothetical protein Fmac_020960 [Flemingia macrophylla]|uniref:DUF7745 domain-containing protein n=1 Tax=Flemingia macrophylla TaxID=520843 RepID=A0ABD1LVJ2_9FABA
MHRLSTETLCISLHLPCICVINVFWVRHIVIASTAFAIVCLDPLRQTLVFTLQKWPKSAGVYIFKGEHVAVERVAHLIKLPLHQATLVGKGEIKSWKFNMLEDYLSTLADREDWPAFNRTLALIVFGTTLILFHADIVDHAAIDAFFAWDVHLRSFVPAILADTLLSVNFCHQKQGKTLRCCSTLLYVWIITHFYASGHMGALPDPLRSFTKIPLRHSYAMEWKAELEHWSVEHFSWICLWFQSGDVLIRCGDYPSVPLMGLRGCIAYTPKLTMRKLMRTQIIPLKEDLRGLCFFYDPSHREAMLSVSRAWEKPVHVGDEELGNSRVSVFIDYKEWRSDRGCLSHLPKMLLRQQINSYKKKSKP